MAEQYKQNHRMNLEFLQFLWLFKMLFQMYPVVGVCYDDLIERRFEYTSDIIQIRHRTNNVRISLCFN